MNAATKLFNRVLSPLNRAHPLGPLLVRLCLGAVFAQSGWGKLHNLAGTTEFFESLGIPAPGAQALFVSLVELVGGLALVVGAGTRVAALLLGGTMVVAIATAQASEIEGLLSFLTLDETVYGAALVWLAVAGAGKASLDAWLAPRLGLQGRVNPATLPPTSSIES